jgi:hypothetical protein
MGGDGVRELWTANPPRRTGVNGVLKIPGYIRAGGAHPCRSRSGWLWTVERLTPSVLATVSAPCRTVNARRASSVRAASRSSSYALGPTRAATARLS